MSFLWILIMLATMVVIALPVKLAAVAMGANRTGYLRCLVALVVASVLHSLGLMLPVFGSIAAFLLAAWGFALILEASFLQGIGISLLHTVFTILLVLVLMTLGAGGLALGL